MYVIAIGSPFDGLQICGPFEDVNTATDYAERNIQGDWWIVLLAAPSPLSAERSR